jgi:hypothetical protein
LETPGFNKFVKTECHSQKPRSTLPLELNQPTTRRCTERMADGERGKGKNGVRQLSKPNG